MTRQLLKGFFIVVLLSGCLIAGAETASPQLTNTDTACAGMRPTEIEETFDWFDKCLNPKCDPSLAGFYVEEDTEGNCILIIEHCDDGKPRIIIRPCKKGLFPLPNIASLTIAKGGYTVDVATSRRNTKQQLVRPNQVKLVSLVRAMAQGSQLPESDLVKVSPDFWSNQKKLALKRKAKN